MQAQATFENVIQSLKRAEGGKNNGLNDYGGATQYGLSHRSYPDFNGTFEDACVIYRRDFWDKYRLSEIVDQVVANQAFLLLINMDPHNAVVILQNAINDCGKNGFTPVTINVDGVFGTKTINALNCLNRVWLSDCIRVESCRYYLAETDRDPAQVPNLRSWIRRALM